MSWKPSKLGDFKLQLGFVVPSVPALLDGHLLGAAVDSGGTWGQRNVRQERNRHRVLWDGGAPAYPILMETRDLGELTIRSLQGIFLCIRQIVAQAEPRWLR